MSKILVAVTGSISAYKAIDFVNGLVKTKNEVKVIMSDASQKFVGRISFFNAKTYVDADEWSYDDGVLHVDLAEWADAFVVYPATAKTISDLVYGRANSLLGTTWLACAKPKIVFPAMNVNMLTDKATRSNMDALGMMRRVTVTETKRGMLACGVEGFGKLIGPRESVTFVNQKINHDPDRKTIIVTSGGTKAPIDGVRVVTNVSSGALGAHIIDELLQNTGYNVVHIAPKMSMKAPLASTFPHRYQFLRADTVDEVYSTLSKEVPKADALIHSMAISDFTFDVDEAKKIKSSDAKGFIRAMEKSIRKSPKIIKDIKGWNKNIVLVGFKFEVGVSEKELVALGEKQIKECGSDMVLVNDREEMRKSAEHVARIVTADNVSEVLCGKKVIADAISRRVRLLLK